MSNKEIHLTSEQVQALQKGEKVQIPNELVLLIGPSEPKAPRAAPVKKKAEIVKKKAEAVKK